MITRPGGQIAMRPLHFFILADCSGSMGLDGKIESLNAAVKEALPHMRRVADDNPYASVLIRVVAFATGARWVTPAPVPLHDFVWTDLTAEPPPAGQISMEYKRRLDRAGAKSGDVRVSLFWHNHNDLDLRVTCPSGEEIYFGHRDSACGGKLDVDMNVTPDTDEPCENVFWPTGAAPPGVFKVEVVHFKNHNKGGCGDPTAFEVCIKVGASESRYPGSISEKQRVLVTTFEANAQAMATGAGNTDMGAALAAVAQQVRVEAMPHRALPPVMLLLSDGEPTDDFGAGMAALSAQPWARKAVRLAIALGSDADEGPLKQFIGHDEVPPFRANNPDQLVRYIRWASTAVVSSASAPPSTTTGSGTAAATSIPLPAPPDVSDFSQVVW
jgi:uncharacterized protein YegL